MQRDDGARGREAADGRAPVLIHSAGYVTVAVILAVVYEKAVQPALARLRARRPRRRARGDPDQPR